jgi:hypothetical protein
MESDLLIDPHHILRFVRARVEALATLPAAQGMLLPEPVDEVHEVVTIGIPNVLGLATGTVNVVAGQVLDKHFRNSIIRTEGHKVGTVPTSG